MLSKSCLGVVVLCGWVMLSYFRWGWVFEELVEVAGYVASVWGGIRPYTADI